MLVLGLSACAHQSKIQPSKGHIDGENTVTPQSTKPSATDNASISPAAASGIPKPVVNNTYLPPPKPQAKAQLYSIVVYDTPVKEVLFAIARDSKLNVDVHPSIQGRVTLNAVDQTLPAILERLSKQVDLTYKIQNNVLTIAPDSPVLRTYQINYVNMQRTTKGGISVANEISSANVASAGGAANSAASSGGGSNTSSTSVESESKNYFWDSLIGNIKDILAESDKEVLVNRLGTDKRLQSQYDAQSRGVGSASVNSAGKNTGGGVSGSGDQSVQGSVDDKSEQNLKNYKTLFAASVIANKETGVLSVRATQRQHQSVQEFIDRVQAGAKRQVLIEASIVEITLSDQYQAGVDWSRLGAGGILNGFTFQQNLLGTNPTSTSPLAIAAAPIVALGYNKSTAIGDLAASIKLLQTFGNAKVLSSPKLMVLNSQTAILKVVDNLVYFTVQSQISQSSVQGANNLQSVTTTPHTVPVGVWMTVTPQINENSAVTLNVRPTIARQVGLGVQDPNPSLNGIVSRIPQIQVREMESMLQVNSGNTVILGGLMQDDINNTDNGIPGLMKVPVVGKAFSAKNDSARKTELVIFLRPTVITNASLESDELSTYKQYLPSQQLNQTLDDER
ncbi:pilus (MSHA type) biogenesis protein MshL [Methylotenera sp.]|uniref:pilus (MSHA type) biogenesis protein MshL n=1 Tax=Methylotenera sp. TaxID=2051956 RepID=UPI00272F0353|nr:pilus (MSHA type) biogenesis protein MshL [Methylotenera sp.]MDP2230944.1 pilus (MSHA type) biogenesis protein MshL [Methylotenera sp.]MDP3307631.1 pilus (MSHA type) biogenesis protein MshL [Methylotenera sp.]